MTEGHTQVEQGLAEFSDRCPVLTPVSPLLAGDFLLAECMYGMELELC